MTKYHLSSEMIEELQFNPFVDKVSEKYIQYSDSFIEHYYNQRQAGFSPTTIFRACDLGPEKIGHKRIKGMSSKLESIGSYDAYLKEKASKKEPQVLSEKAELKELRKLVKHQANQIEFLKKNWQINQTPTSKNPNDKNCTN